MTPEDLRTLIQSDSRARQAAEQGDDKACLGRVLEIAPADIVETRVTYLEIAARVGQDMAVRLINTINAVAGAAPLIGEVRHLLRTGNGIDVGDAVIRTILDGWGADGVLELTPADADAIKALAERSPRITLRQVSRALASLRPGGRWGPLA